MNGILVINKPKGKTSHDIVSNVKKIVKEKVGHTGTLDPNATGVLPILIGKGTLCSQYLIEHDKIYEVILKLGEQKDTGDIEGKTVKIMQVPNSCLEKRNIKQVLKSFIGEQQQIPPIYSAIKINGKKLYEYAREGKSIEIKPRKIKIFECELQKVDINEKEIYFKVHCSKGTYIRTLCEDIARQLGTVGYMKELNRIQVGKFSINRSISIEELKENIFNQNFIMQHLITIEEIFREKNQIIMEHKKIEMFLNGVKIPFNLKDELYRIYDEKNNFIGIGSIKEQFLKRKIIL